MDNLYRKKLTNLSVTKTQTGTKIISDYKGIFVCLQSNYESKLSNKNTSS